jgi:HK97 family phage portal protein
MGLLSNIIVKNYSLTDFEKDFESFFYGGWKTNSGIHLNEQNALKFGTVFACVRIISEDIGMLSTELRKWRDPRNHSKGSDPAFDHPLYDVLLNEPNQDMVSMLFDETLQQHILLSGNGYAYKNIDTRGRVRGLKLLNWQYITPQRNKETKEIEYLYDDGSTQTTFRQWEIFHIPGLGFDGIVGYSPVKMAMEAIGLGLAAEQFASMFYSNGANVGGIVTMPGAVKDKESLRAEIKNKYEGLGKAHKLMVLEEGMTFQKMVMPLAEAQFIETRKFQKIEIAQMYRMPLKMIQDYDKSTYSNNEQQELDYVKHTILPWVRRWEQSIDTRLLTKEERRQGYFARFNFDELLRGDAKTRADVNHIKRQDGIISGNEWRAMDDMNPRPEKQADALIINGNMREISVVNEPVGKSLPERGEDNKDK